MLQKTGMALFVIAVLLLMALLFLHSYTLSDNSIRQATGKETPPLLLENLRSDTAKTYNSQIAFNQMLKSRIQGFNDQIREKYAVTSANIERITDQLEDNDLTFSREKTASVWETDETGNYQQKQFNDYSGWLEGRTFEDRAALTRQLVDIQAQVNNSILESRGFNDYRTKNLQLALTRASMSGPVTSDTVLWLLLTIGLGVFGALVYILPKLKKLPGIKNNGIWNDPNKSRGWIAVIIGSLLILFYVVLYWFPEFITPWMALVDPVSKGLNGGPASQWFFYGLLYTLAILVMGVRMLIKYRHSKYHLIRTCSVMFFQTAFAFIIPEILIRLNQPSMDLKNIWPLNYTFFFDYNIEQLSSAGTIGTSMLVWGIALAFIGVPVITYFYGKRWYCSWVCGCGGLAETLGDPYRHLSDKSVKAWKIERWMVHGVLAFAVIMTIGTVYTYFTGAGSLLGVSTYTIRSVYGFVIGAAFAGVVGVGFYPLMGNRVWCRFGCPLAAYLGLVQRFKSRFRITTNGGQCISCGNCSTYCEMGIDVRWYAQRGQNIVRASCVGCGVCSSVCPRGVLKLENGKEKGRFGEPVLIGDRAVSIK